MTNFKRLQFDFDISSVERLDEMVKLDKARSRGEVLRRALRLYDECITAREDRGAKKFGIIEKDGGITHILLPL